MPTTKQQMVDDIKKSLPQAYAAVGSGPNGANYYAWASGIEGSSQKDREFAIYQAEGLSQHLKNTILCYLNLPSVGYDDFSNEKKVQGDQYRGYVARAKAVYDGEVAELSVLQTSNVSATVLAIQNEVIAGAFANWQRWIQTLNDSLKSGSVV